MVQQTVYGGPTKRFFVAMLTRDIELTGAILDLIDNCVDGAMRLRKNQIDEQRPYAQCHAHLSLTKTKFEIRDNCGGIPNDRVEEAFSLGRPNIELDGDLPTIGMYGIGMKRAIFKIGNAAKVESNSKDGFFSVEYTSDWLKPENDQWDLPITKSARKNIDHGVVISIDKIKKDIGAQFANDAFINALKIEISEHFGYLMQKGFSVKVNGEALKPRTLTLFDSDFEATKEAIRAFDFETTTDGVHTKVTIGLFRTLARETEVDSETEEPTDKEKPGISVVCNDRVILLSDTTMKTGWGDGNVPRFHPQFRAIAGVIVFTSNNAEKLPISTTKRDLDMSSEAYLAARKIAMEGLKTFTNFTNKWKGIEEQANNLFKSSKRADARREISSAKSKGTEMRSQTGAVKYVPPLPAPKNRDEQRRISFMRSERDIGKVSKYLFDDSQQNPSVVGEECFDRVLTEAKKKNGR
jgi:hypothetical protein